jgi:S-ribosylhomocysteine lyase
MAEVESFTLDHTKVKAPYVRLIAQEKGSKGDLIANYDLRFLQPNEKEMPTGAIHTLEHLLADLLRDRIDGIIDISPFGCRTGFHLITWNQPSPSEVAKALTEVLEIIVNETTFDDIQGVSEKECGNYRDHSLYGAKEYAKLVLEQGISDDAFVRNMVN